MLHGPVRKQFCYALCTVKCGLVSELVIRANPQFFICRSVNKISNFGAAMITRFFYLFDQKNSKNLPYFCLFCKVFTINISRRIAGKLTVKQKHPLFRTSPCNFLVNQTACFVGLYFS